jgi:hypothetical protein
VKAALARDPRAAPLTKQLAEIAGLTDRAERKRRLTALAPQLTAVRNDALKAAGIDAKLVEKKTEAIRVNRAAARRLPPKEPPPAPGSVISTVEVTSFPKTFSHKHDCPDSKDTWDFDGKDVKVKAVSTIADDDCWKITAGRTATVQVPPGAKKMTVVGMVKVDLDVVAISFGFFSEATGYYGIRAFDPSGAPLMTVNIVGTVVPVPARTIKLKTIGAINYAFSPLPFDSDGFADDLQEGEEGSTATFGLPSNVGPKLEISPVAGGWVDGDMQGYAKLNHLITPKKLKVTFYR